MRWWWLWVALIFSSLPASAQAPGEISAVIGIPGETDRFAVVTVRRGGIEGCLTSASRVCTRTRRVELDASARRDLDALLARIRSMPRCEPIGFAPGDPEFTLHFEGRTARGHLPAARADVPSRIDSHCEAEHALAWWIVQRFESR